MALAALKRLSAGQHWRLNATLAAQRIGWPKALCVILLGISTFIYGWLLPELQQHTENTKRTLNEVRRSAGLPEKDRLLQERQHAFKSRLLPDEERAATLKFFFAEAESRGISLSQGDYALLEAHDGRLRRWQVTFPVKGSYPKIRAFITAVLEKLHGASLDEISFSRSSVQNPTVEAKLKLSIYLKTQE